MSNILCSGWDNFCIKYKILLLLLITIVPYYLFHIYQEKINFNNVISERKRELLSQINGNNNLSIFSETYAEGKEIIIKKEEKVIKVLDNVDLNVEFYSQSPFGKWGPIFEDTCEEASALIAINYIRGNIMTREEFRDELLNIVNFENIFFGYYKDTNVDETAQILEEYFKFTNFEILNEPTIEDMKMALSDGNIIITPLYAIGMNPNFTGTGPNYHFIVIKGYDGNSFITHDVGTKMGENYKYNQLDIMERLHDFDSKNMLNGEKKLIVLKKR